MASASGYITEFNRETNFGYIQIQDEESSKRLFRFHLYSLKKHSTRYVTKDDSSFIGELFDFDIIQRVDGAEEEAINIRHSVLRCPILECSRLKAFTNKKALNDHIESKHRRIKKVTETSSPEAVTPKRQEQRKKTANKSAKLQPFIVNLVAHSASTLGRFIGKSGVNLKLFQRENNVYLKIVTKPTSTIPLQNLNVQVQVKPYRDNVNVDLVREKLKLAWGRAVREQKEQDDKFQQLRLLRQQNKTGRQSSSSESIDIDGDARLAVAFTMSDDGLTLRRRTKRRQTGAKLRSRKKRSSLSSEGHRCAATCDPQEKGEREAIVHQKKKTSMKDKQWILKEQLYDV